MKKIPGHEPQSTDPRLEPRVTAFVVYDAQTGAVLHTHQTVTFGDDAELEESALEQALRLASGPVDNAAVIEVHPEDVHHRFRLSVDIESNSLRREPR